MFNMNRCYRGPIEAPIVPAIVPPIQIKYVHSNVSYQKATKQKYDWRGHPLVGMGGVGRWNLRPHHIPVRVPATVRFKRVASLFLLQRVPKQLIILSVQGPCMVNFQQSGVLN